MSTPHGLLGKAYVRMFAAIGSVLVWAASSYLFGWIGFWVSAAVLLALWIRFNTDNEIG